MSLECRTEGCHRTAVLGAYCEPCTDVREQVFEHGGTLDGVQVAPRGRTRDSVAESAAPVRAVRFDLQKFGRGYIWTREAALAAVCEHAEAAGGVAPTRRDAKREKAGELPSAGTADQLFGSWEAMIVAAGLVQDPAPRQVQPEPILEPPADSDSVRALYDCALEIEEIEHRLAVLNGELAATRIRYHSLLGKLRDE